MNEFNWEPDQIVRYRAAAAALVDHEVFHNLLTDLASAMQNQLIASSISALRMNDPHRAISCASEAQGIADFITRLEMLESDLSPSKTSRDR